MSKRALIIEDDRDIAELVRISLEREHFHTTVISDGHVAYEKGISEKNDIIVLDIMLPGVDGFDLCRYFRHHENTASVPILILSAKTEEFDRVLGLELGADDYLTKPFSPRELVARVKALLRRAGRSEETGQVIKAGALTIDVEKHIITVGQKALTVSAKEFGLLLCLVKGRGRVFSRDQLLDKVWGHDYVGGSRTVDVHIRHLREKLDTIADNIVTVKSVGYKFVAE